MNKTGQLPDLPTPTFRTELGALYQADCIDVLRSLPEESVDLLFADPPFNLRKNYGAHFKDSMQDIDYLEWMKIWVKESVRLLSPGGAFFLFNLPRWNISMAAYMQELGLDFRHWIAVDLKAGLPIPGRLYPSHYSLLYFTNGRPRTFVRPRVPIQTCRHCHKMVKDYGGHLDKIHPDGLNVSDVWLDIPVVRHRRTKNRGANELSERMLERVLTIASEPGDMVLDPFGGSGTTFAVAERMHRHWIGIELGEIMTITNRLNGGAMDVPAPGLGDSRKRRSKYVADSV